MLHVYASSYEMVKAIWYNTAVIPLIMWTAASQCCVSAVDHQWEAILVNVLRFWITLSLVMQ